MTKRIFTTIAEEAKYRVSMKRKLRQAGVKFDNGETTECLEEMIRIHAPRTEQFDGVVKRAMEGL